MPDNCPECGAQLPGGVFCNIHGVFCSETCINATTARGYPRYIADALATLRRCYEDAPVDFLGTGSNMKFAEEEQEAWQAAWEQALADITTWVTRNKGGVT